MPTFIMIELSASETNLMPSEIYTLLPTLCSQRYGSNSLSVTTIADDETTKILANYANRWAVGASAIWDNFPEMRGDFLVKIERSTIIGPVSLELKLNETIYGDILIDTKLSLYDNNWINGAPPHWTLKQEISIFDRDFSYYEYLLQTSETSLIDLRNYEIYCCSDFSIPK